MASVTQTWLHRAIATLESESAACSDTPLRRLALPADWGIDLYFKDESAHPTGSLKHRLARSLVLHALVNGLVDQGATLVEASSGSTAVSEAYFAQMLGLPFVAVMTRTTSPEKIALIEAYGGRCEFTDDPSAIYATAQRIAEESGGHYLDQFTNAERATDWRGNNNIADSIIDQMAGEQHPVPSWVVVGAGTGGTSATIGRYVRYKRLATRVCVVDPEGSAFLDAWTNANAAATGPGSRIEGIGRPRVEPSFVRTVIDRLVRVPDNASIGAMQWCTDALGTPVGASTGTALWGAFGLIDEMRSAGERGSIVVLLCDGGERYADTYYSDQWLADHGFDPVASRHQIEAYVAGAAWPTA
ncbi:cysteine synthase [Nocardioides baekrokdamisoli]|uniref:L-cysteine desulfhydrase Cds1 n=1 Tax=Nocardioides baekrokdamisoli TaxID=1804624 RepID=A0A3G9IY73_9ACTN|nr:PLP-dependent cysteine synthase family protein [Nocardioides baekrokdamisoli]BBH16114.1 cysteine synthase [Nocardioides baekrokdamisoli]